MSVPSERRWMRAISVVKAKTTASASGAGRPTSAVCWYASNGLWPISEDGADARPLNDLVGFHLVARIRWQCYIERLHRCNPQPKPAPVPSLHLEPRPVRRLSAMRDDYFREALAIVGDPDVLVSMTAERVTMLRRGSRPLVEFPETPSLVDVALREIVDGRIKYVLGKIVIPEDRGSPKDIATRKRPGNTRRNRSTSLLANPPGNAMATA